MSAPPHQLPEIKRLLRSIDLGHAREVAARVLRCATSAEVVQILREALDRVLPDSVPAPVPSADARTAVPTPTI